jgi:putative PIN family toxin of toxin-antitoxin system
MCSELYDEISEVLLEREKIRKWLTTDKAHKFLDAIRVLITFVPNPTVDDVGLRDSDDAYIVALARREACDYIVTGDRDLLEWADQKPPCVTPKEFLNKT